MLETGLADTQRLLRYRRESDLEIHLNLKGFSYAWIIDSFALKPGSRVLDVGAGYSVFPQHLAKQYGCEVWAVDDFGLSETGDFWERNQEPEQYIQSHPEIKYVIGRLGMEDTELPENYFDLIYSASALEHVPTEQVERVWQHMDRLLKPDGCMLHTIDIAFPTSRGWKHVGLAMLFDAFYPLVPVSLRKKFTYETPKAYLRRVSNSIAIEKMPSLRELNIGRMVLDSEIVTEPLEHTYHRMVKDGMADARYFRTGSLLISLRKTG